MRLSFFFSFLISALMLFTGSAVNAQDGAPEQGPSLGSQYMRVKRQVHTVKYTGENRPLTIDLAGTALMPKAEGHAKIQKVDGGVKIEARVNNLAPARSVDAAELTYVLWALATDGTIQNLGELKVKNGTGTLTASTKFPAFAMVVTAEPYFAVKRPSEYAVLYNRSHQKTENDGVLRADLVQLRPDPQTPLEVFEARNAVRIARQAGAERYAADSFHRASQLLQQAESIIRLKRGNENPAIQEKAREATLAAEDARARAEQRQGSGDAQ